MGAIGIMSADSFEDILKFQIFDDSKNKLLIFHRVNNRIFEPDIVEDAVMYCAVRINDSYNLGVVVTMIRVKRPGIKTEVIYRTDDEGVLPNHYDCPIDIIRILTPVKDLPFPGSAEEWRQRCIYPNKRPTND